MMCAMPHTEFSRMNDSYAGWPMDRGAFAWEPVIGVQRIWAQAHKHTKLGGNA
jgi:hypothetical protein